MSSSQAPSDAPPPYSQHDPTPHKTRNGIPPDRRRSMEDESRPLPAGWIRQFDAKSGHQFFVDTDTERSIWHHPYDDEQYLSTLSSDERERVQSLHRVPTPADVIAESSDEEDHHPHAAPKRQDSNPNSVQRWGRKVKDKVTNSTHQQRQAERQKRADDEKRAYEKHLVFRRAMTRAIQTGEPQKVGQDSKGKDVYICPPEGHQRYKTAPDGRLINPYNQGAYANPNARYLEPRTTYRRPYGYGYGGGYGLPLAAGLGGLGGGLLLGDLAFGGLGGGLGYGGMGMGMGGMGMGMGGMGGGMGGMGGGGC